MRKSYKVFLFLVAFLIQTCKFKDFFKDLCGKMGGKVAFSTKMMILLCKSLCVLHRSSSVNIICMVQFKRPHTF